MSEVGCWYLGYAISLKFLSDLPEALFLFYGKQGLRLVLDYIESFILFLQLFAFELAYLVEGPNVYIFLSLGYAPIQVDPLPQQLRSSEQMVDTLKLLLHKTLDIGVQFVLAEAPRLQFLEAVLRRY